MSTRHPYHSLVALSKVMSGIAGKARNEVHGKTITIKAGSSTAICIHNKTICCKRANYSTVSNVKESRGKNRDLSDTDKPPGMVYRYEDKNVNAELKSIFESKPSLEALERVKKMESASRKRWEDELKRRKLVNSPRYDNPRIRLILKRDDTIKKKIVVSKYDGPLLMLSASKLSDPYAQGKEKYVTDQIWEDDDLIEYAVIFGTRTTIKGNHRLATVRRRMKTRIRKAVCAIVENGLKPDGTCDHQDAGQVNKFLDPSLIYNCIPKPTIYRAYWLDVVKEVYNALLHTRGGLEKQKTRPSRRR